MTKTCCIDGCDRPFHARDYCCRHYSQWYRKGAPGARTITERGKPLEWLREQAECVHADCVRWPFAHYSNGYGSVWFDGKLTGAHRLMCRWAHGEPPPGTEVAHACHVRDCVNPLHLRWATHRENIDEREQRKEAA